MKVNTLQLRRALCAALFVLLLNVVGMNNALAQNQVATLQHNDTITGVFYGSDAFTLAYSAAVDGDDITLSSGFFSGINIGKSITIHGAGPVYDSLTGLTPTIITGNIALSTDNISFEGVQFTGAIQPVYATYAINPFVDNINFLKCNINSIGSSWYAGVRLNWQFVDCIIKSFNPSDAYYRSMSIINSVVRFNKYKHNSESQPTNIHNSVVVFDSIVNIKNIVAFNSIIATSSGHDVSNCTFYNCIGIKTGETSLFEGQIANNTMEVDGYDDVFKTFAGTVSYEEDYKLKENIATTFLGSDGKEVGIYGGLMPYKARPGYMIIKNCNVASQTDANKKLSVEIELLNDGE